MKFIRSWWFGVLLVPYLIAVLCEDYHRVNILVSTALLTGWLIWRVSEVSHWSVGLFMASGAWSAMRLFLWPTPIYGVLDLLSARSLNLLAAMAFVHASVICGVVLLLPRRSLLIILKCFAWLGVVNSVLLIFRGLTGDGVPVGVLNCASMDAFLISMCLPLMFEFLPRWLLLLPVAVVLWVRSSTSIGAIPVGVCAWILARMLSGRYRIPWKRILAFLAIFLVLAFLVVGHQELVDPSGRQELWPLALRYWIHKIDVIFGSGTGTFWLFGAAVSSGLRNPLVVFTWMHNDWLQVLFEQGAVGFLSLCLMSVFALIRARKKPWLFSSLAVYGFCMLLQMPLRLFYTTLLGAMLIREAFDGEPVAPNE